MSLYFKGDEKNGNYNGEVFEILKGKGISKNDVTSDGVECIRYGELCTTYS